MTALFFYGLVLKILMTSTIVVAASLMVERSGPFIGSLIASLPTAGGAALIILAIEHSPSFIAASNRSCGTRSRSWAIASWVQSDQSCGWMPAFRQLVEQYR